MAVCPGIGVAPDRNGYRVNMPGLRTKNGLPEQYAEWGRGATIDQAVENMWSRLTASDQCVIVDFGVYAGKRRGDMEAWVRWNGFMWEPYVVQSL